MSTTVTEPQRAGDFLRDIMRQAGRSKTRSVYNEALDTILSSSHRPHCQIVGCRGGRLVVEVDSAPLFAELIGFRREEIRLRINQLLPEQPIAQLTFRLGGTGHV
ncbi:MAG: DciA family protein [Planctomycetota bacterium]